VSTESVLEIRIRPDREGYHIYAKTSGGVTRETSFRLPSSNFVEQLVQVQRSFAKASTTVRTIEGAQASDIGRDTLREIGSSLFDMIFTGDVRSLYTELHENAINERHSNRISIRNDVPELISIPWELLYDKKIGQYLSCYHYIHLTRGVDAPNIVTGRPLPITVLGMAARPKTIDGRVVGFIDADTEQRRITDAFSDLEDQELVDLSWTGSCSVFGLSLRLDRPPKKNKTGSESWDVFHFIGHGGLDSNGVGYVIVQEDGGIGGKLLEAGVLSGLLARPDGPQLVVLSSCSGAQAKPGELFSDTASTLVRAGVPAVVAMQSEISDQAAILFMTAFYTSLANRRSLQHALTEARNQLKGSFPTEWPTPVLYLRCDGRIFQTS
jgi:CHAT domain-containing protein